MRGVLGEAVVSRQRKQPRTPEARHRLTRKLVAYAFAIQAAWYFYRVGGDDGFDWVYLVFGVLILMIGLSAYGDWRVLRYVADPKNDSDFAIIRGHEGAVYRYRTRVEKKIEKLEAKAR